MAHRTLTDAGKGYDNDFTTQIAIDGTESYSGTKKANRKEQGWDRTWVSLGTWDWKSKSDKDGTKTHVTDKGSYKSNPDATHKSTYITTSDSITTYLGVAGHITVSDDDVSGTDKSHSERSGKYSFSATPR